MIAPDLEFQGLVYAVLKSDAVVMALATDIYDNVPKAPAFPYVTLGASDTSAVDAQGIIASKHNLTVHVWSQNKSKEECKNLSFSIKKALHQASLTIVTHAISNVRAATGRIVRDPDGLTNHGTIQVSAIIEEK